MRTIGLLVGLGIATGGGAAWAQDDEEPAEPGAAPSEEAPSDAGAPPEVAPQRHVLPAKRGVVQAFIDVNLSAAVMDQSQVGKPVSVAPDVWYGVTDVLTVGVVHSARGMVGVLGASGAGLCLTGEENGCAKVYDNVGVDVRYHLKDLGDVTVAADGGLFALTFDPFQLALKVGAIARWSSGKMAADLAPSILLGITEREPEMAGMVELETNKEIFFLPATFYVEVIDKLALAVQAAAIVPSEQAADTWILGASLGGQYMVSEAIFADLAFSLPHLAGGGEGAGADQRTLSVGGGYAF